MSDQPSGCQSAVFAAWMNTRSRCRVGHERISIVLVPATTSAADGCLIEKTV